MRNNFLLDADFLKQLNYIQNKTTYAKITLLTWEEYPIEEIQGKITQGSVNIDGSSAVRRTCSLTMILPSEEIDVSNTHWALRNKFKLEVGIENNINDNYPKICWFKQGVYVFSSLNMSKTANNFTISLSGKDKMCLLNGEMGGLINASTDFGQLQEQETLDNGEIFINLTQIPIVNIIKNAVSFYAGISQDKIYINDIDDYGLELLEYLIDDDNYPYLYMLREETSGVIENATLDKTKEFRIKDTGTVLTLEEISNNKNIYAFDQTNQRENYSFYNLEESENKKLYNILCVGYGDTAGYRITDLVYPGELVINIGESLVSLLDKIKNMFSNFEYYFDVNGNFIFQKKKTYTDTSWSPLRTIEDETYVENSLYSTSSIYAFEDEKLFTNLAVNPNLLNFKNDYSIWGKNNSDALIHLRYAIEDKPKVYVSVRRDEEDKQIKKTFYSTEYADEIGKVNLTEQEYVVDWREIIYQMALDYYNLIEWLEEHINDTSLPWKGKTYKEILKENNPETCPNGRTGYENFYIDQMSYWRGLYFPGFIFEDLTTLEEKRIAARAIYFKNNVSDPTEDDLMGYINDGSWKEYYKEKFYSSGEKAGYLKALLETPEDLNYYFDFMDMNSELGKYSISSIGIRSKVINDEQIKSIYYKEVPQVIIGSNNENEQSSSYTYLNLPSYMESYFTISSQGKSAWDELQTQLYTYTNLAENITLTTVPIYYLEPNNVITIHDNDTKIHGKYIITKITIPLNYNGTSSISASKIQERIY